MEIGKNNAKQFLSASGVNFNIPVYQRNYDWAWENCERLLGDLRALARTRDEGDETRTHFLGTICSKSMPGSQKTIIDGQQRITTLSLLLRACVDFAKDETLKRDIEGCLRNMGYGVKPGNEVKLRLNRRDNEVYARLLEAHGPLDADALSEDQRSSSIWRNYSAFREALAGAGDEEIGSLCKALDALIVVDLDIGDENPQEIFESLNSTGLDLTDVDLLRNYLLMALPYATQKRLYDRYWYPIEERVHSEDPENMVRFFIDYLIYVKKSDAITLHGRQRHINKGNLYVAFKQHCRVLFGEDCRGTALEKRVESLLSDMLERAESYKRLVFAGQHDMNKMPDEKRIIYSIVVVNKGMATRPVLLWILEQRRAGRLDDAGVLEMLQAVLSLVFRSKVCGGSGMNGQTAGNVLLRLASGDTAGGADASGGASAGESDAADTRRSAETGTDLCERFWRAITCGVGKFAFPDDAAFENALCDRAIFEVLRAAGAKYLLYELERHTPAAKGLPRYDDANTTVEHIMPKTLSDWWRDYLEEDAELHSEFLNKLGNLALTPTIPRCRTGLSTRRGAGIGSRVLPSRARSATMRGSGRSTPSRRGAASLPPCARRSGHFPSAIRRPRAARRSAKSAAGSISRWWDLLQATRWHFQKTRRRQRLSSTTAMSSSTACLIPSRSWRPNCWAILRLACKVRRISPTRAGA